MVGASDRKEVLVYTLDDVDHAPEDYGIYAWYGSFFASLPDYSRQRGLGDEDLGESNFRAVIASHSQRYKPKNFSLKGRGNFGSTWSADMVDQNYDKFVASITGDDSLSNVEDISDSLSEAFKKVENRSQTAELLKESFPYFSSPIYIGKSSNIRRRLKEHADEYYKLKSAIQDPDNLEKMLSAVNEEGSTFAARCLANGFSPDHLQVAVLPISIVEESPLPKRKKDAIITVVEWLLNRWHRPILGRR